MRRVCILSESLFTFKSLMICVLIRTDQHLKACFEYVKNKQAASDIECMEEILQQKSEKMGMRTKERQMEYILYNVVLDIRWPMTEEKNAGRRTVRLWRCGTALRQRSGKRL